MMTNTAIQEKIEDLSNELGIAVTLDYDFNYNDPMSNPRYTVTLSPHNRDALMWNPQMFVYAALWGINQYEQQKISITNTDRQKSSNRLLHLLKQKKV